MKTVDFFIQQPHAEMLVRGLRNAIPDEHFSKGDRIYINAAVPVLDLNTPLEQLQEVINQQLFGNLPPTDTLPYSKCIGFVDVLCRADGREGPWSAILEPTVIVTNAHEFDTPQPIMPRKSYEAEDIPSHKFRASRPYVLSYGDELVIPVNDKLFRNATQGGNISLELSGELASCVLNEDKLLKDFEKLTLVCGRQAKSFIWTSKCDVMWEQNPNNDELKLYPSVYAASGKAPHAKLLLTCEYPLIG